jgi:hypothetical protein
MLQVANEFHNAQINDDKKLIDELLTEDFTESGLSHAVQTPDVISKRVMKNFEYSKVNFKSIEANYPILLNMFSNSVISISFVRKTTFILHSSKTPDSFGYYVTYTFEETADGLKINKIERKL